MLYFLRFKSSCYLVQPLQRWLRSFQRWSYKRTCHFITFYKALRLNLPSQAEKFTHPHITWLSSDISQCSRRCVIHELSSWVWIWSGTQDVQLGWQEEEFTALWFKQIQHSHSRGILLVQHNNKIGQSRNLIFCVLMFLYRKQFMLFWCIQVVSRSLYLWLVYI